MQNKVSINAENSLGNTSDQKIYYFTSLKKKDRDKNLLYSSDITVTYST